MSLIKCPECGKDISDKADICINCGFPMNKYIIEKKEVEKENKKYFCSSCNKQNEIGEDYCVYCGMRLTPYCSNELIDKNNMVQEIEEKFNGIYRYTLLGGKQEVYCPRCGSENCSHYQEQKIIPGKSKTRYTANLNPLRPFTLVNKKEKVIREDKVVTESKFVCNSCGKVFS